MLLHRSVLVLLALFLSPTLAFPKGFDDRFVAATGDLNGDGIKDIYIRQKPRIVPIPLDDITIPIPVKPAVEAFVLEQRTDGSFAIISQLSSQQRSQVAQWPIAQLTLLTSDLNVDGFVDLIIKDVSDNGVGTFDQIVFANSQGNQAQQARRIDPDLSGFITDAYGWLENQNYFEIVSVANDWFRIEEGETFEAYWSLAFLLAFGYTASDGSALVASDRAARDPDQIPPACGLYDCYFDVDVGVWRILTTATDYDIVYDDFKQHFNADAVDFGKMQHDSLDVLAQIINRKLGLPGVGGGERGVVANDDNVSLSDAFWTDLLLHILLHDNYCAITLECSVTIEDLTRVDMIVDRQGTGSYVSGQCGNASINYTHGTYQISGSNGANLSGFTLERGGPDSTTPARNEDVCTNIPKRIPQGTYDFSVGNTPSYSNVPRVVTNSIGRTGILVHNAGGAKGTIGCILVSKTSGASGTFVGGNAQSLAALNEIRQALTFDYSGQRRFQFLFGKLTINNNGN